MRLRDPKLWIGLGLCALVAIVALGVQRRSESPKTSPFDGDRAFKDLETMVGHGPRPAGSAALERTRQYLVAELRKAGLQPILDEFDAQTPKGSRRMTNIRAVRPGAREEVILLAGHYDTKEFDFRFDGANDGGSSAAWLLEMARVTRDVRLQHGLEFIFFDGEEAVLEWTDEDSVYGSRYDVARRIREKTLHQVKALVLVDMIGDKNLNIRQESASTPMLREIIWGVAHSMGYTREFLNSSIAISDDHIPFLNAGVPAVDIIDFDYPYWHTAGDTLDKTNARSLKIVGDVVYNALPVLDARLAEAK